MTETVADTPTYARPAAPQGAKPTRWGVIAVAVLAGAFVAGQIAKAPPALPLVRQDLGISLTGAGWVIAAFSLVAALAGGASGALTARLGTRATVVLGLLLAALGSALGALAPSGAILIATRVVEGAGFLAVVVAAPSLIAEVAHQRDAKLAFGFWGTYMGGGQATMLLASPALLAGAGWRGTWWLSAAALVTCAVAARTTFAVSRPADRPGRSRDARPSWRRALADALSAPGPRVLTLIFVAYSLQFLAVVGFLPTIYQADGVGTGTSDLLTGGVIVGNLVGNFAAGVLLKRGVARSALIVLAGAVMGLTAIGIYSVGAPLALAYPLALAFSTFGGLLPTSLLAGAPVLAPRPELVPTINGLLVQGAGIGQLAGPVAVGALAHAVGGWQATPLILSTAAACSIGLALRLRRIETGRQRDSDPIASPASGDFYYHRDTQPGYRSIGRRS